MKSGKDTSFIASIVHSDRLNGCEYGAIHQPIHATAQFAYHQVEDLIGVFQNQPGYSYARQGTPSTAALEKQINNLEEGDGTLSFASGMAALQACFFSLLRSGDHLISSRYIFGNTNSLLSTLQNFGVEVTFVDPTHLEEVVAAKKPNTRMVFTETISNPGTFLADLKAIGDFCKANDLVYLLDSTLTTPFLLKGREVGASLVMHSLSKSLGGHALTLGGTITNTGLYDWSKFPNIYEIYQLGYPSTWGLTQIKKKGLRDMGACLSSDSAHRISIGLETFALRMKQVCDNALQLAQFLENHPAVNRVWYPGLASHPQHERANTLFKRGYGGLIAVELKPEYDLLTVMNRLRFFTLATHLGDNRTLTLPVAQTIYWEMGAERRKQMGIADTMMRISVGIEEIELLKEDFNQACAGNVT